MFSHKKISKVDLKSIIANAAKKLNKNTTVIEKDYWVCFVLDYIFSDPELREYFIFKGGTSLSKCYGIISRFSEDIDLILDWSVIDTEPVDLEKSLSKNKQDKQNKESNKKAGEFIKDKLLPKMVKDFAELIDDEFTLEIGGSASDILFKYPSNYDSQYISSSIKLEIGPIAAHNPSESVEIKSDIQSLYPQLFLSNSFKVIAISPERTFWEKATILHSMYYLPEDKKFPDRYARHYYDLYCFMNTKYKESSLSQVNLLEEVIAFKDKYYHSGWANFDKATPKGIRIIPQEHRLKAIKKDYHDMIEMFYGDYPDFEDMMKSLKELEEEISNL